MDIRISLQETGELERRLHVEFPGQVVEEAIHSRLRDLGRTLVLNGYRRGKVPLHLVRERYGTEVRRQVLEEQLQRVCRTAIQQSGLDPAGPARIQQQETAAGEYLSFHADFDVYPGFSLDVPLQFAIQKPVVTITESDVDELVERLRRQLSRWRPVSRAAEAGDRLTLEVTVSPGSEPDGVPALRTLDIVLGAGQLSAAAEQALTATTTGAVLDLAVTHGALLPVPAPGSGPSRLRVRVCRVSAVDCPEIDAGFCRALGIESGDVADLRVAGRDDMRRETSGYEAEFIKAQLARQLREQLPLALPGSLVELELAKLASAARDRGAGSYAAGTAPGPALRDAAERNVHWAMVVRKVFREQGMRVQREEVNARIDATCPPGEDREARQNYYYEHPALLDEVEYAVMEGKVVDWLLQRATVTEKAMSFVELAAGRQAYGARPQAPLF